MVFCIDSNIFIWGLKKQSSPDETHRIDEARDFLEWADGNKHTIMIPSVVIAECLSQEPIETHAAYLKVIYDTCIVANFDERSALVYSEILNQEKFANAKELAKSISVPRDKMKVDYLIVACAIAHGANRIYSHDKGLTLFAEGLIEVQTMPTNISKPLKIEFPE